MERENILARIKSIPWYQSIDLGNGIVTPGRKSLEHVSHEQNVFFNPVKLEGATVLDVGAWAGAHSFEAKRRGAARVMAADHFVWVSREWRGREAFDIANNALGLGIEALDIDVPDIKPETVGTWDVVLFLGVLYHLPSPLEGLKAVASVANDCLVVETAADLLDHPQPALSYHPSNSLGRDDTNFFTPNAAFVIEVLRECGFVLFDTNLDRARLTVHAWRNKTRRVLGDSAPVQNKVRLAARQRILGRLKHELRSIFNPSKR